MSSGDGAADSRLTAGRGRLAEVIATRGGLAAPEAPFVIEHRGALIYMLCEAAELEHGIMCQYLFAAFSLKKSADEGLAKGELAGVFGIAQWFPGSGHEVMLGPAEDDFLRAYSSNARALPDYPAAQAAAGAVLAVHCARLAGRTSREDLWAAAATLDSSTLFGAFKIDPRSGTQVKHQTVLVRWDQGEPVPVG